MCTKCFQRFGEVIFYPPTVKLHLCFQHQLLCFMGWLQQMFVSGLRFTLALSIPASHLCPCVAPLSLCLTQFLYSTSSAVAELVSFLFLSLYFSGEFLRGSGSQWDPNVRVCQPSGGDRVHYSHQCLPSPQSVMDERRQSLV